MKDKNIPSKMPNTIFPTCQYCGVRIKVLPYRCRRCKSQFCDDHRLPEDHECPGLLQFQKKSNLKTLISLLKNINAHERKNAAQQLKKRSWTPQTETEKIDYLFANQCWDELVDLGSSALEPLISGLMDEDTVIQESCAKSLGKLGNTQAIQPLIQKLNDYHPKIRTAVAIALNNLGWQPEKMKEKIDFLVAQERWNDLINIGSDAIDPLLDTLSKTLKEFRRHIIEVDSNRQSAVSYYEDPEYFYKHNLIIEIIETLGEIQDVRVWNPLLDLTIHEFSGWPNQLIFQANKKIDAHLAELKQKSNLFCKNCFHKFIKYPQPPTLLHTPYTHYCNITDQKRSIPLLNSRIFNVCRNCKSNKNYLEDVKKVVLKLDKMGVPYRFENGILDVNWYGLKKPIDMNEISIIYATKEDIAELVMKLRNDDDSERRQGYKRIPVIISKDLTISQAQINLLKNTFGNVQVVKKDTINCLGE